MTRAIGDGHTTAAYSATVEQPPPSLDAARHDPRMDRSRQRVLGAALDLAAERGIAGASIQSISARSGVAKTTIYRQWPHQAALLLDAFRSIAPDPPLPDTGSLRGDLYVLLGGFADALGHGRAGVLMAALIDAAQRDPNFADLHAAESRRREQPVLAVIKRGQARGELSDACDLNELVDRLAGPVLHRRFISGQRLTRQFGEQIVDSVLREQ